VTAVVAPPARSGVLLRLLPARLYAGRAHVVFERSLVVYRGAWLIIASGFAEPLLYLFALGTGLHTLVGSVTGPGGRPLTYAEFIAPALLASSAMNGAVLDATVNVFFKMKYAKLYDSMLATSLGPIDVAMGEIGWALFRGGLYAAGFLGVMLALGLVASPWAALLLPAALLIACGFAAVGMAVTTFITNIQQLDVVELALLPLFLFSGTFYSLDVYPRWLQIVVECLPLHHGIVLLRGLNEGVVGWSMLGHAAYFAVMAIGGATVAARRLDTLLLH
jgi:lipooligosaccharide transport system permease protein